MYESALAWPGRWITTCTTQRLERAAVSEDWQGKSIPGFSTYRSKSAQDAHALFAQYNNISTAPYNLDVMSTSPAVNAGTNLGVSVVGVLDYAGNPRTNAHGQINIGAYEQ